METNSFLLAMSRGRCGQSGDIADSAYCVFTAPLELQVTQDRIYMEGEDLVLELLYGLSGEPGALRLRQMGLRRHAGILPRVDTGLDPESRPSDARSV